MRYGIYYPPKNCWLTPTDEEMSEGRLIPEECTYHQCSRWFAYHNYFCKTRDEANTWLAEADRCYGIGHVIRPKGKGL